MKTHHPKIKTPPRPLFSCGIFSYCTQTVLSPTNPQPPPLASPPPPPPPPPPAPPPPPPLPPPPTRPKPDSKSGSESSSSSTSQSFTQWRFPIPESPRPGSESVSTSTTTTSRPLVEVFRIAEIQLGSDSYHTRLSAIQLLERTLLGSGSESESPTCPPSVMGGVVAMIKDVAGAKPATKVLLALCLTESNRHVAVEAGAVNEIVGAVAELEGAAAERALAALELLCTVREGAERMREHALGVPMMVQMMGKMGGRGKESAISVLAVIYGGAAGSREGVEPPDEVARAVVLALGGECSERGRRKGGMLLRSLESGGVEVGPGGGQDGQGGGQR